MSETRDNRERINEFGFATPHDAPIPYLQRIRTYYGALGYGAPYEWAHFAEVPFHPLKKPLSECRVAIITTAAPYDPTKGDQGPGAPYNAAAKFYSVYSSNAAHDNDLRISHIAIDRTHTTAEDLGTYFPFPELRRAAERGRIRSVAPHFHGCPRIAAIGLPWGRLSGDRGALQTRDARCCYPRCKLPHLPSKRQPGGPHAGGERHLDRGDGMREGHCRICRRSATSVLRFSTRQRSRPAQGLESQAFTLELALSVLEGTRPAHHCAVAACLGRQP